MKQGMLFSETISKQTYESHVEQSKIFLGSAESVLNILPENYFQTCITSPPYWGLRDYGVVDQIGAEKTIEEYIANLVRVFQQVKRTLKDDGTLWLNIGDAYTSGNRTWRAGDKKNPARAMTYRPPTPNGLKPKDLIGIPWRLAFALQEDGWFLRSDIIWNKPNCQPESVKDRPTRSHEYVFLFAKNEKYFYDYESVKENATNGSRKNKRSVWNIKTEAFAGAHFATFPEGLVLPCILAGSKKEDFILDPFFGSGTVGHVAAKNSRKFIGIEINPEYIEIAKDRIGLNNSFIRKLA